MNDRRKWGQRVHELLGRTTRPALHVEPKHLDRLPRCARCRHPVIVGDQTGLIQGHCWPCAVAAGLVPPDAA